MASILSQEEEVYFITPTLQSDIPNIQKELKAMNKIGGFTVDDILKRLLEVIG